MTARRRALALAVATVLGALAVGACSGGTIDLDARVDCQVTNSHVLAAQSVPSASYVPCVAASDEFQLSAETVTSSRSKLTFSSTRDDGSWTVELTASCDVGGATLASGRDRATDQPGVERYEADGGDTTLLVFDGGCVTSQLDVGEGRSADADRTAASRALGLLSRTAVADHVDAATDGELQLDPPE